MKGFPQLTTEDNEQLDLLLRDIVTRSGALSALMVERAGYRGFNEVEIFSERNWWQRDPDEVLSIMKDRYRSC